MINKSSLMHISENRELLIHDENFAYLLPCEKLKKYYIEFYNYIS